MLFVRGLRAIKFSSIIGKDFRGRNHFSEAEMKMLQKLVKQRKESADIYIKQNRADLAQN